VAVHVIVCCVLCAVVLSGCEALQRKFTRKPTQAAAAPNPIISFQDYTRAMTPMERYRKHYLMFGYWNGELLDTLQDTHPSPKRLKRVSGESLSELKTIQGLLSEEKASHLSRFVDERVKINEQLQAGSLNWSQTSMLWQRLESQTRHIQRDFSWRDVEDDLKPDTPAEITR
jgi:hypothetical protein